jgi:hypothetical protein
VEQSGIRTVADQPSLWHPAGPTNIPQADRTLCWPRPITQGLSTPAAVLQDHSGMQAEGSSACANSDDTSCRRRCVLKAAGPQLSCPNASKASQIQQGPTYRVSALLVRPPLDVGDLSIHPSVLSCHQNGRAAAPPEPSNFTNPDGDWGGAIRGRGSCNLRYRARDIPPAGNDQVGSRQGQGQTGRVA